jgi:replicative DNA helicase
VVSPIDVVLGRLDSPKRTANGFDARCPAHDDRGPSLGISQAPDGRVLLRCRAGCSIEDVLGALELVKADLFPPREQRHSGAAVVRRQTYALRDVAGELVAEHERLELEDGSKRFVWRRNGTSGLAGLKAADLPLYGSEMLAGRPGELVLLTEGEKAADAARGLGFLALGTATGAASAPGATSLEALAGRDVILWPDLDDEGRRHMERVAIGLAGVASRVGRLEWPEGPRKGDAADFTARGGTLEQARALVRWLEPAEQAGGVVRLADVMMAALEDLDRFAAGDFSRCVPTGIPSLDRRLGGGLRNGQVTLVGASTGGGKTTVLQIMASTAAAERGAVLFVSPEMAAHELAEREILQASATPKWKRSPWRSMPESVRAEAADAHRAAAERLRAARLPLWVLDRPASDMDAVAEEAEALRRREGLSLVVLDYAQELAAFDERTPRYLAVGAVAQRSVALARELDVPVLIASQVNVTREGSKTVYSFRESAILEHKAHTVLVFVVEWREGADGRRVVESAAFRAMKNRSGPLFELKVDYEPELFSIADEEPLPSREIRLPYSDQGAA